MKERKFLGINLDNNLSLGQHFNILYNKLLLNKGLLTLSRNTLSTRAKPTIYYAYICTHLTYTIVLWGSVLTDNKIEKLYKIQKECFRYIVNANKTTHRDPLFKKCKILKMKDIIIQLELVRFRYGRDHKIHPQPILHLFKNNGKNYWN